uniref:DUF5641 domain-containing protein n=1 Tax=Strigamia maritima TaxID=126957 RepID=T1JAJ3_STRMM
MHRNVKIGDVVLIQDENQPRSSWQMGQVEQTFLGRDNKVRSCEIRLSTGKKLRRPVQRLCLLEAHEDSVEEDPDVGAV